jgi:type VI secretion system protein
MRGQRLLERLRAIDQHPDWRDSADPKTAIASVIDHLIKILNSRQGSAPTASDLGMPDFTSLAGSLKIGRAHV